VLLFDSEASWDFFRRDLPPALAGLGWQQGRNLALDWRFADRDAARLPGLAQALLRAGAQALLTPGTPATRALQQATRTVPIVTGVGDPVGAGFAASLSAPGGNITGLSYAVSELTQKQIQLLREMVPRARRLIVLLPDRRRPAFDLAAQVERSARAQGLLPQVIEAADVDALRRQLRGAGGSGDAAAFVIPFGTAIDQRALASVLLQSLLPAVFDQRGYVESGGLMSYRLDWDDQTGRTAAQLDKVLRGANPAELPFELPTRSQLVINAASARALGLEIPAALRLRADEVIP
jgi:putative ABC transport system substrate-binding protein